MEIKKKKTRRCDLKIETKEGKLLKYLRESRNLSVRSVGRILGTSGSTICHVEHGRKDANQLLIEKLLEIYGYTFEDFKKMLRGEVLLPENLRDECIEIIKRLDSTKLKAVKAFLNTFLG